MRSKQYGTSPSSSQSALSRGAAVLTAFLLATMLSAGCSLYRVHAPTHPGVTDAHQVVWSWAWGLVPGIPEIDCQGQALAEVTVKSHFGFDLVSVLSLGLASPKRFEWKCAGATPSEGTLGFTSSTAQEQP